MPNTVSIALTDVRLHPRVAQQSITAERLNSALDRAAAAAKPFRDRPVHTAIALIDWDHHLPSRTLSIRLHICYDQIARERFEQGFEKRMADITAKNKYPEFDVPDYSGLLSDEVYDIDLTSSFDFDSMRFVSPWRRQISDEDSAGAVAAVQASPQFADLKRSIADRPGVLGELEAVGWTPPCESGQPQWTLDVWWLTSFDGRIGRGWSFLVDLAHKDGRVTAAREFTVRAG